MKLSTRYALHSLLRSRTRTLVSVLGIAIGVAIGVVSLAWIRGESDMMARATAESGQGHAQMLPQGWHKTRDTRLRMEGDYQKLRKLAEADQRVAVAAPQVEVQALLGMGTRVQSVGLLGVDPQSEPKVRRTIRHVAAGRYLQPGDKNAIVIGKELARRLDVELGDELVVTSVAPGGDLNSALLPIVGLVASGSAEIDSSIAHVVLERALSLSGRPGVSRIALLLHDGSELPEAKMELRARVPATVEVLDWMEVNPGLVAARETDAAFSNLIIIVVIFLVILGITSAQLTGVLQRGREFSVLLALGMKRRTLYRLIFTEALLLGILGALLSLLFSALPLYYLSQVGVDFRELMGDEGMAMGGTLLDPIMKADAGPWVIGVCVGLSLAASLIGAIYPARYSHRLDPASVLRSRN